MKHRLRMNCSTFISSYAILIMTISKNVFRSMKCGCTYFTKRFYSEGSTGKPLLKYVFVSESNDIFENLAIEDWFYENYDLSNREILLLWRNTPAIVIGRHQNPWLEANVEECTSKGIQIVRRNSGGGTVYHDLGNLNLSFLTSRKVYNRVHNLEVIARSLKKEWGIESKINGRSDIIIGKKKVSGTASKLSRKNAYHHCTLLVDVNKHFLSMSLCSPAKDAMKDTSATASKPASIMNLRELNPSINIDRLITVVGLEYLSTSNSDSAIESRGFHFVKPSNKYFSGLDKKISEFKSWKWIFGRTPRFTIVHSFNIDGKEHYMVHFQIKIEAAVIKNISIDCSFEHEALLHMKEYFKASFSGKNYSETVSTQLQQIFYDKYYCDRSKLSDSNYSKC